MSENTPGPWTAEEIVPRVWEISAQAGTVVLAEVRGKCDVGSGKLVSLLNRENDANAKLMAAAPELLARLQARRGLCRCEGEDCARCQADDKAISKALEGR